jgi:hypothetical protein
MSLEPHIPVLRRGRSYTSLDQTKVADCRTGEVMATVSTVNAGIIRKDLRTLADSRAALARFSTAELVALSAQAGDIFLNGTVTVGEGGPAQSPEDYVRTLSATSGLPWVMVRRNMAKIHHALTHMGDILDGLTRGLPWEVLDRGRGEAHGCRLCFHATSKALGLVMPSNSPAVNSLWLPAIALKTPVIIKPGRDEPWTPYRLIQSFVAAGCPAEAFGFYPTDHEGAAEILRASGRALIFGDQATTQQYANNPAIEIHGPGFSKVILGEDVVDAWRDHLDVIEASISENGGRSCINASAVVVPRHGREIAEALAQRLGPIVPRPADDPEARLSAFANPKMAEGIDAAIEADLRTPGVEDLTARHRHGSRKVVFEGATYLRPTVVHCDSFTHPLANREFLFPYASVIETPQAEVLRRIGPSLVVTAITRDPGFQAELLASPDIERLNLGPIPTTRISWDQPHEGNLFEFLYRRRSFEQAAGF